MVENIKEKFLKDYSFDDDSEEGLAVSLPLDGIKARFEDEDMQPTIGYFLKYLVNNDAPRIILEDGNIIRDNWKRGHDWEFTNVTAKLLAKQYNGIFFKSHQERSSFLLTDFIEALRRCIPNKKRKRGLCDEKFDKMIKEQGFKDLEQELAYLKYVEISASRDIVSVRCSTEGLVGKIHKKDEKGEDSTFFNTKGVNGFYEINLGLSLEGFGYEHLNVSQRRMATEFSVYGHFDNDSDEASALSSFIRNLNPEDKNDPEENYGFSIDYKTEKNNNNVNEVILRLESPTTFLSSNYEMEEPVMQTRELLPMFINAADTVHTAIKKADEYRKAQEKRQYEDMERAMGLIAEKDNKVQ